MFNKKNKTKHKVNSTPQTSPSLNMISEGTKLKGTLSSKNDVRIAGQLDGEINCKSKLIVTSSAYLEGDVISVDADIAGNVDGTLKVSNKLILRKSAKVGGDVYTKVLVVEEGAQINGAFKMGENASGVNGSTDATYAEATKKVEASTKSEEK